MPPEWERPAVRAMALLQAAEYAAVGGADRGTVDGLRDQAQALQ